MNADDQAQIVTFTLGADQFAADVAPRRAEVA